MDLNAASKKFSSKSVDDLEMAVGRVGSLIEELHDGPLPETLKQSVLTQVGDLLEMASVTGSVNPVELTRRPVASLGSGPSTPAPVAAGSSNSDALVAQLEAVGQMIGLDAAGALQLFEQMFDGFDKLPAGQAKARAALMTDVAQGNTRVIDHGTHAGKLQVEVDLETTQRELRNMISERDALQADNDSIIAPINALPSRDQTKVKKALDLIVKDPSKVNSDGTPVLPAPNARVTELEAAMTDVKDHLKDSRITGDKVLRVKELNDKTKEALGLDKK